MKKKLFSLSRKERAKLLLEGMGDSVAILEDMTRNSPKSFNSRVVSFLTAIFLYLELDEK